MMNNYINPNLINNFFAGLNQSGINYVLIKNVGDELPNRLKQGKDVDIVVHPDSKQAFHNYIKKIARQRVHPRGKECGWHNMYGLAQFEFWRLNAADDFYIDVTYQLCCHSLMPNIWIPLDNVIQIDIWKNKIFDKEKEWWKLDDNLLFTYLIVRCVFDKQVFSELYIQEIEKISEHIEVEKVKEYLKLVFFKFTEQLMCLIKDKEYSVIIESYLKFKDY